MKYKYVYAFHISSFVFGKLGKESTTSNDEAAPQSPSGADASKREPIGPHGTVTSAGSVAETTSAEMAADFVCNERFADNFWTNDERCISVLMHKLKSAKQTCTDILHMASLRAQMEEDLGKKLTKLARSGLGTEEVGETKNALRTVRAEMENNAKAHLELAKQLRLEIEKPLSSFIADQRNKRRSQTSIIQKTEGDRNALRSQLRKLQDKRRSDTKKVGDLDLQVNGLQSSGDPKLRAKLERAQMQQKATENEYNDVRERLKEADSQWFNVWRSACDVFQVLEEERIEYLKTVLWTYTNLVSSCCVADDESMERIRQDLEKISVADDIAEFIHTFGTGAPDPELARKYGITLQTDDNADERQKQPAQLDSDDEQSIRIPTQRSFQQQPPKQQQPSSAMSAPVNSNTVNSMSTSSGTARSGSILAHPVSRPQTQESVRQYPMQQPQQQRPASMHAQQMQPQPMMNGRPASSMHGHVSADNTYRRASNNDMYAMANGAQPQYIQRTNSQMAMRSNEPPAGYMYVNAMDPRAPSSMGAYHSNGGTNSPVLIPAQQMQPHHPQRPGTPSQVGANGSSAVPQRMESPRSRAGTFNGPAHTGNFGTLTGNPQMQPFPPHHHQPPNSSPGSPYQQAMNGGSGNGSRPSSSMGMQNNMGGSPHMVTSRPASVMQQPQQPHYIMTQPYRSATPVQQSPQYVSNVMSRPPTQMSHSPVPQVHPQQMGMAPSPQMHQQRAPSVMGGGPYGASPQMGMHPQQRPMSRVEQTTNSVTKSGKEILFYVKVLYDYDADNEKELTIREGDVISVLAVSADGWWEGEMTDRRTGKSIQGTFPSNFTDPISNLN
ncbi:formin-binding protein [Coemansia sp. RSA 1250]|nr:formin-binding protein [Coemansia sp. RSA 1250]